MSNRLSSVMPESLAITFMTLCGPKEQNRLLSRKKGLPSRSTRKSKRRVDSHGSCMQIQTTQGKQCAKTRKDDNKYFVILMKRLKRNARRLSYLQKVVTWTTTPSNLVGSPYSRKRVIFPTKHCFAILLAFKLPFFKLKYKMSFKTF